jgi:Universal stress protein family
MAQCATCVRVCAHSVELQVDRQSAACAQTAEPSWFRNFPKLRRADEASEGFDALSRILDSEPVALWQMPWICMKNRVFTEATFGPSIAVQAVTLNSAQATRSWFLRIGRPFIRCIPTQLHREEIGMEIDENKDFSTGYRRTGTLLFVADFVNGSQDVLDLACEMAEMRNAHLQLLHVIDLETAPSNPDGQMGSQFGMEMFAERVRAMKRSAVSLLAFGCPELVIPRRAAEVNASVIVIPLSGSANDVSQKKLVRRLMEKCDCPVLTIPPIVRDGKSAKASSFEGSFPSIRRICEGKKPPQEERTESGAKQRRDGVPKMAAESAYSLGH